jgi:hypothetical protein
MPGEQNLSICPPLRRRGTATLTRSPCDWAGTVRDTTDPDESPREKERRPAESSAADSTAAGVGDESPAERSSRQIVALVRDLTESSRRLRWDTARPLVVSREGNEPTSDVPIAGSATRSELRAAVTVLVRALRAENLPPEVVLVRVKRIAAAAGLRGDGGDEPAELLADIVRWSVEAYYAE